MHKRWAGFVALLASQAAAAIPPLPPPQPPRAPFSLQIAIRIDGLTADLLREYRLQLTGGLKRLTETAPAPLITPIGGGQFVVVSGDSSSAPDTGTSTPLLSFAWDGRGFGMAGAAAARPRSVALINDGVAKLVSRAEPALVPPAYCLSKSKPGGGRFARAAGDYAAYARSPSLDGATLALAAGLIPELGLGRDPAPDLLRIELPVTGRVAVSYGASSEESCLQLFALDRDLGDFLAAVDRMSVPYEMTLVPLPTSS